MIRLFIAEDQKMLLGALGSLLDMEKDMEVVGQTTDGQEALAWIDKLVPDICLLDIEMPGKNGLEAAEEIKQRKSSCKVIILTTFARPGYFERAVKSGVCGYLVKDSSIDELAASIRKVMEGERVYSPELMIEAMQEHNPLSARELEVLRLAAEGKTTKEMTHSLFLSSGTVRNYMSEILQKLDAKNRMEAIRIAEEKGWL
ncbi:response regulator transcription factor [Salibacterium aidingense]|uniref:response regulator transcription factor n=1 Tax=Salibacterium aidingense TaxID=384933 RepID=UPI003BE05476